MEMKRIYLLADWIVQNKISDGFHPDWNPDLKAIWPLSNIDPQDALDRALDAREYKLSCSPHKVRSVLHGAWKRSVGFVVQLQKQLVRPNVATIALLGIPAMLLTTEIAAAQKPAGQPPPSLIVTSSRSIAWDGQLFD